MVGASRRLIFPLPWSPWVWIEWIGRFSERYVLPRRASPSLPPNRVVTRTGMVAIKENCARRLRRGPLDDLTPLATISRLAPFS